MHKLTQMDTLSSDPEYCQDGDVRENSVKPDQTSLGHHGVAVVREKYLENEIFSRSGKSQGILWMASEIEKGLGKSGNLKINGYGRQSSENLVILLKREKDVPSHKIV